MPVLSATLPVPANLEAIIRSRQTNDFPNLTQSYYRAFGVLPAADETDPTARNMIDMGGWEIKAGRAPDTIPRCRS